jgi:hypothetical protein
VVAFGRHPHRRRFRRTVGLAGRGGPPATALPRPSPPGRSWSVPGYRGWPPASPPVLAVGLIGAPYFVYLLARSRRG